MSISIKVLGRSVAIAALTAGAVAVGATTAGATVPAHHVHTISERGVTATADSVAHTVSATLAPGAGTFVLNPAAHTVEVVDADGRSVESIPLTVEGKAVPAAATVSHDAHTLTLAGLHQVSTSDTANRLWGQWLWGVQHGGAVGAVIGWCIGCFALVIGCLVGAGVGGAATSPNSAQIQHTFNDLVAGR